MCLSLNEKYKLKIAKKDIICYKLVDCIDGEYLTIFQKSPVVIGETYNSELYVEINPPDTVRIGLHSIKFLKDAKLMKKFFSCRTTIIKCVIPVGSKYYSGDFIYLGDIAESMASNKITYVEEISVKN